MHMLVGSILGGKSIKGFLEKGLVEVHNISTRHQELAEEMAKRGMKHKSELKSFPVYQAGTVNVQSNLEELKSRCPKCKSLIDGEKDA